MQYYYFHAEFLEVRYFQLYICNMVVHFLSIMHVPPPLLPTKRGSSSDALSV